MSIYSIYRITNNINGKCYVGYTSKYPAILRFEKHKKAAQNPKTIFHKALKHYGADNFTFEVLYESKDSLHTLSVMEPHFIKEEKSFHKEGGYNGTFGGRGGKPKGIVPWNKGKKGVQVGWSKGKNRPPLSEEWKKKISLKSKVIAANRMRDQSGRFLSTDIPE
jgi:group I intron endonuclease